ncbi:MAG: bifunctional oligoribonuclease/PAP phosphatase NrnA [Acidimicrobiia bacterium]|nr:bifunctional oligoribonuclease/PAP phosphatase NrnA [Acidimicrobiia bacterium]
MDAPAVEAALTRAAHAIAGSSSVALACHVNPDGDALGSMLALHHALLRAGWESVASFPTPFEVATHYRELPGLDLLAPPSAFPAEPDVMVTFDCGALGRLGDLEPAAKAAGELVVLDHHVSNTRFGTINVIDPSSAATGVLVRRLMERLALPLDRDSAVCLYAALVCDTGRFQYETTTAEVFDLASELVTFDVPVPRLSRALFEEHRFAYLQLLGEALTRAVLVPDLRFVWTAIRQSDLHRFGVSIDEVEGLVDVLRRTAEAEVTCVLKEEADGSIRVSLRSLGAVDVRRIAQVEGGGGHRFAAGFTSLDGVEATVARVQAALGAL